MVLCFSFVVSIASLCISRSAAQSAYVKSVTMSGSGGDNWVDDPTDAPVSGGYGEAIVGAQGKIYLAQTSNATTADYFYCYDPLTNAWSSLLSVSGLPGGGTGDFRNGTALVWDNGDYIYSLLGGSYGDGDGDRYFFYRYSISGNSWTAMASTTPAASEQQSAGGALTWVPGFVLGVSDDNFIYAFAGNPSGSSHRRNFLCYSVKYNNWTRMADAPGGVDDGGSLAWVGNNYIYALQGECDESGYNDAAWRYNIITNTWDLTGKFATEVGDGGSMIWTGGDYIYATSGCTSGEDYRGNFYRYNFKTGLLSQTDWVRLADLPEGIGYFVGCRIGFTWTSVGSLDGDIYGWRGTSGSYKFWKYNPEIPSTSWMQTDWKGGLTKPTLQVGKWTDSYDNFYDNENVNWLQAGKIMLENVPGSPPPGIADNVVISEFATRGPSGAYDEFVELYNPTSSDVSIGGCIFEYYDGSDWSYSYYGVYIGTIPSGATIHAHGFYLWGNENATPGARYSGTVRPDWSTAGKGLKDDTPAGSPRGIRLKTADNINVIDTVVFEGDGNTANVNAEGGRTAPNIGTNVTNSVERKAQNSSIAASLSEPDGADAFNGNGYDTDNNANNWVRQTNIRNPENSASPLEYPPSVTFKSAGWFESSIYDAGEFMDWKEVRWSESTPSGTDIIVKLRTGNDNNPYNGGWSGWYQHTNHTENSLMLNSRYVQYQVKFSTTNETTTPQLFDILISYDISTDNTAPPAPALVSPSNGAVLSDNTPTFDWTSVFDPSGVTYDIQVDNDPSFSSPEVNVAGLISNTYTSPVLADENYSWRVRAVDGMGNVGNWSSVRTLLIYSRPYWTQTDWSGGPTKPSLQVGTWTPSYVNFYDNENVDWSAGVKLRLQPSGVYRNGWFESSIFDVGSSADWGVVTWSASTPSQAFVDNYMYVSSYAAVKGTVTDFDNEKAEDGNSATLAERQVASGGGGSVTISTQDFSTCTTNGAPAPPPVGWTSVSPALQSNTGTQNHTPSPAPAWSIRINAAGTGVLTSDTINYTGYVNPDVSFWFRGTSSAVGTTKLYYSISGGAWVLIYTQTPWPNDSAFHLYTVSDITALNGLSSVKFKWEFIRTGGTSNSCDDITFTADVASVNKYDMEINENIDGIPSADTQTLQLRYKLANTNDNFRVQVYNGSTWENRGSALTSTSWTDWSYSLLDSEVIGGKVQVRFVDNNPNLTSQDNLLIDYLRVRSYSAPWSTSIVVKARTNTTPGDSNPYDGGWSGWYQQSNGVENTLMENGRYVQYRVELSTTNENQTPVLQSGSVVIYYTGDTTPPPTPSLVSPSNGTITSDNTPTFEWTSVSDPSGVTYTLEIIGWLTKTGLTSPTYTLASDEALPDGTYSWHVQAVDGAGNVGEWSESWTLTIDTTAPAKPSLVSPANGANIFDNTPTFEWTSVTDPSGVTYQIQVDDNDDFSSPVYYAVDLTAITHTLPDENALALFVQYFWHVRAKDGVGNIGDWSEEWNFTVVPVGAIGVLLMPLLLLLPFALMLRRQNRWYQ